MNNVSVLTVTKSSIQHLCLCLLIPVLLMNSAVAKDYLVSNQSEFRKTVKNLKPGDHLILKDGVWRDFKMAFVGEGKQGHPITLRAQTKGKVIISGRSNLRLGGQYLVASGLVFKNGYSPTSEVISFKKNGDTLAYHSRVTEMVVDNYNKPNKFTPDYWVGLYGKNNRFDHNHLVGKKNRGVTMAVRLNAPENQNNHHRIDHNYFGPRPIFGSNGGETIRIGTSKFSLTNSNTVVEFNYFDRCNGEVEVVSNKSGGNIFRNNVFFESRGTLTLRHGNGNLIENNFFFGNGKDHTGGIRVINANQTVRNNYMYGLTGYRFGGALVVMNGAIDPPINRYHQVKNSVIENNSIINSDHIQLAAGADEERNAPPKDSVMTNNFFYSAEPKDIFTEFDDVSGIKYSKNALVNITEHPYKEGFADYKTDLELADNGLYYPTNPALFGVGISRDVQPISKDDVGVTWYAKSDPDAVFDQRPMKTVKPGVHALQEAILAAGSGSILELVAGDYLVDSALVLVKPLTIKAKDKGKVNISFTSSNLFTLAEGSALKLIDLNISGAKSKNSETGNSLVKTKSAMLGNYQLIVDGCRIQDLNSVPNFNFLTINKTTVADLIQITNSQIENVTGSIFELNKEIDDIGIYNAEYVNIVGSSFKNIDGMLINLYRGGKDESTFGPHFMLENSTLSNIGKNEDAAIILYGVQVAKVKNNHFKHVKSFMVNHTVGEPITEIVGNTFEKSFMPVVTELVSNKKNTALIENNKQI